MSISHNTRSFPHPYYTVPLSHSYTRSRTLITASLIFSPSFTLSLILTTPLPSYTFSLFFHTGSHLLIHTFFSPLLAFTQYTPPTHPAGSLTLPFQLDPSPTNSLMGLPCASLPTLSTTTFHWASRGLKIILRTCFGVAL